MDVRAKQRLGQDDDDDGDDDPRRRAGSPTCCRTPVAAGLLRPARRDAPGVAAWWFAMPRCGAFAAATLAGRRKLQPALKRSKYKELNVDKPVAALKKACPLGQEFHVRDLVGRGDAELVRWHPGSLNSAL